MIAATVASSSSVAPCNADESPLIASVRALISAVSARAFSRRSLRSGRSSRRCVRKIAARESFSACLRSVARFAAVPRAMACSCSSTSFAIPEWKRSPARMRRFHSHHVGHARPAKCAASLHVMPTLSASRKLLWIAAEYAGVLLMVCPRAKRGCWSVRVGIEPPPTSWGRRATAALRTRKLHVVDTGPELAVSC